MYDWETFNIDDNTKNQEEINLILKNKIMKLEENFFDLNDKGINAHFDVIMSGDSYVMLFSRLEEDFKTETAVFYINKELDSSRKFINFGLLQRNSNEDNYILKTIRKQEITKNGIFIYLFFYF